MTTSTQASSGLVLLDRFKSFFSCFQECIAQELTEFGEDFGIGELPEEDDDGIGQSIGIVRRDGERVGVDKNWACHVQSDCGIRDAPAYIHDMGSVSTVSSMASWEEDLAHEYHEIHLPSTVDTSTFTDRKPVNWQGKPKEDICRKKFKDVRKVGPRMKSSKKKDAAPDLWMDLSRLSLGDGKQPTPSSNKRRWHVRPNLRRNRGH